MLFDILCNFKVTQIYVTFKLPNKFFNKIFFMYAIWQQPAAKLKIENGVFEKGKKRKFSAVSGVEFTPGLFRGD